VERSEAKVYVRGMRTPFGRLGGALVERGGEGVALQFDDPQIQVAARSLWLNRTEKMVSTPSHSFARWCCRCARVP
jgi:hypothetical protein